MPSSPSWTVMTVFDPDGEGADFAYTVGLHEHGLPELHLWARPTLGEDPGADWSFSPSDRGHLLNDFARQFLAGELTSGQQVTHTFDGGAVTVTFTIGQAGDPGAVEAYQVAPGASVIPIPWSLTREPEGALTPLTGPQEAEARQAYAREYSMLPAAAAATLGSQEPPSPDQVSFAVNQPYGPTSAFVSLRAALFLTADADQLADAAHNAMLAERGLSGRHVLALARAAARPAGRSAAQQAAAELGADVVDQIVGGEPHSERWREVLIQLGADPDDPLDYEQMARAVENLVRHAVAATLTASVVPDHLDQDTKAAAYGPLYWAVTHAALESPSPLWDAPTAVLDTVRSLVGDLTAARLTALAAAHRAVLPSAEVPEDDTVSNLYWWCRAKMLTSQAALPPLPEVLAGTAAGTALEALNTADTEVVTDVLAMLTAALTHRDGLSAADRDKLAAAYEAAVPGLRDALNAAQPTSGQDESQQAGGDPGVTSPPHGR